MMGTAAPKLQTFAEVRVSYSLLERESRCRCAGSGAGNGAADDDDRGALH